jgi:hypothetical protein
LATKAGLGVKQQQNNNNLNFSKTKKLLEASKKKKESIYVSISNQYNSHCSVFVKKP